MKVKDTPTAWEIKCRHCGWHTIPKDGRWAFNNDFQNPTFIPSINEIVNSPASPHYNPTAPTTRCHFTIANGQITYMNDCSHNLRGTFDLEDW